MSKRHALPPRDSRGRFMKRPPLPLEVLKSLCRVQVVISAMLATTSFTPMRSEADRVGPT
jgi:hypothetical protein